MQIFSLCKKTIQNKNIQHYSIIKQHQTTSHN